MAGEVILEAMDEGPGRGEPKVDWAELVQIRFFTVTYHMHYHYTNKRNIRKMCESNDTSSTKDISRSFSYISECKIDAGPNSCVIYYINASDQ